MNADAPQKAPDSPVTAGPRERILVAAASLFYEDGLHAVSADRIIAAAGVSKVTFYRYFATKDDLIVAYLSARADAERAAIGAIFEQDDLSAAIRMLADGIGAESCSAGFRGCPFINAAAEYPDPVHPVRRVVDAHRSWYSSVIASALTAAGTSRPEQVAKEMLIIRDGAMMMGYLGDPSAVADSLYWSMTAVARFDARV